MDSRSRAIKTLIEQALKHQRPGTGSSREFLSKRTTVHRWLDLTEVLSPIPWAVVGAAATRLYMPERMTLDLDIAVLAVDAAAVRRRLAAAGFQYVGELTIGCASWRGPDSQPVDIVEVAEPWLGEGILEAQSNRDAQGLPVLPFRFLVLMKFRAGRVQDIADVTRMLGQADKARLADVRAIFDREAPQDREDLESLIGLGKLELG